MDEVLNLTVLSVIPIKIMLSFPTADMMMEMVVFKDLFLLFIKITLLLFALSKINTEMCNVESNTMLSIVMSLDK